MPCTIQLLYCIFLFPWWLHVFISESCQFCLGSWHREVTCFFAWHSFGMNHLWGLIHATKLGFNLLYLFLLGQWLNFKLFGDYIFSRENKVQTFFFRVHWLSECFMCIEKTTPWWWCSPVSRHQKVVSKTTSIRGWTDTLNGYHTTPTFITAGIRG